MSEIGRAYVHLVADRAHHRRACREDGARDNLLVERPEILERTTPAPHHQDVEPEGVGMRDGGRDFARGRGALHACGHDDQFECGPAPSRDVDHIAHRRARRTRDDRHAGGEGGKLLLVARVE